MNPRDPPAGGFAVTVYLGSPFFFEPPFCAPKLTVLPTTCQLVNLNIFQRILVCSSSKLRRDRGVALPSLLRLLILRSPEWFRSRPMIPGNTRLHGDASLREVGPSFSW